MRENTLVFFVEALGWEHGVEFVFVAFQNRVAYAMGGTTLHSGGDIQVGGYASKKLNHTDVDILFIRNQQLRWVLADEVGMTPDDLLGAFASQYSDATLHSIRYRKRSDGSLRIMSGYNLMSFGDLFQLPPIPASAAIFIPPQVRKTTLYEMMSVREVAVAVPAGSQFPLTDHESRPIDFRA